MKSIPVRSFIPAIFISAFLLFQIQPIMSKTILPWFGGTPSVWTLCMLFFQSVLFGGYVYAHLLTTKLSPRFQTIIHGSLLLFSLLLLWSYTIIPPASMRPAGDGHPTLQILSILFMTIGCPYFTLAATSPLLQYWYGTLEPDKEPYILYSFSNAGSFIALLSYPFVAEPLMSLSQQATTWNIGFTLFFVNALVILITVARNPAPPRIQTSTTTPVKHYKKPKTKDIPAPSKAPAPPLPPPRRSDQLLWIVLPMIASVLLLAVTNQLCTDIASGPFMWVVPLSIYLLSFIIAFNPATRLYNRLVYCIIFGATALSLLIILAGAGPVPLIIQIILLNTLLFTGCVTAHSEVYQRRPGLQSLTRFYLSTSLGGMIGGIFTALIAPMIFFDFYEFHLCCLIISAIFALFFFTAPAPQSSRRMRLASQIIATLFIVAIFCAITFHIVTTIDSIRLIQRNFFGVLRVQEDFVDNPDRHKFRLLHGTTEHGAQLVDPSRRFFPTSYYSVKSGVALALSEFPRPDNKKLSVGVIGMGIGTVVTYAFPGDEYLFYEINPLVYPIAQDTTYFSYIAQARKRHVRVYNIPGDARISMENQLAAGAPALFDVLILDAFTSDAIPMHLLTREAFNIYRRLLRPNGLLAVHISNRHLDLSPVVSSLAHHYSFKAFSISNDAIPKEDIYPSLWILVTNNPYFTTEHTFGKPLPLPANPRRFLWSDDYCNLLSVMRSKQ